MVKTLMTGMDRVRGTLLEIDQEATTEMKGLCQRIISHHTFVDLTILTTGFHQIDNLLMESNLQDMAYRIIEYHQIDSQAK